MNNLPRWGYRKYTLWLIAITTVIRLILSGIAELNNDEVYYITYARYLRWNYFDHPPMVGIWIKFFTAGLHMNHELFIRLGSVTGAAISTWLIFLTGKKLKDNRTGWLAACLFTASFYSSVIAGLLILPDSPQLVFWILFVYLAIGISQHSNKKQLNIQLLMLGIAGGFCILSKVHGLFCWFGFGGYILFCRRELLKNPFLYLGALITVAIITPSLLWSFSNQMGTYDYHSGRIAIHHLQPDSFFRELIGSFFYNNPVNVVLLIGALLAFRKKVLRSIALLLWLGLPLIITVMFLSLFNDTLPHWSGPGYTTLILVTALHLSEQSLWFSTRITRWAMGIAGVALAAAFTLINCWPGTLGSRKKEETGKHDVTLDMSGWRAFGHDFATLYQHDSMLYKTHPRFIFNNYWFPAGHLDFYVARPLHLQLQAIGSLHDIHHFAWLNKKLPQLQKGEDAYFISISNFNDPVPQALAKKFEKITDAVLIPQSRGGKVARYFYVYRLIGFKAELPESNEGIPVTGIP